MAPCAYAEASRNERGRTPFATPCPLHGTGSAERMNAKARPGHAHHASGRAAGCLGTGCGWRLPTCSFVLHRQSSASGTATWANMSDRLVYRGWNCARALRLTANQPALLEWLSAAALVYNQEGAWRARGTSLAGRRLSLRKQAAAIYPVVSRVPRLPGSVRH